MQHNDNCSLSFGELYLASLIKDPLHLRRRHGQLLLAALMVLSVAWDLRAVLADRRISPSDTTTEEALHLQEALVEGSVGVSSWLRDTRKGPLAGALVFLVDWTVGEPVLAGRLVSVLLHALLLWQVCLITLRLCGAWSAGLCASLICATFPMVYGWFRLDYHEPLVAVCLLWCLQLMLGRQRWSTALWLGLALALGVLSKLAFGIFIWAPLLLFAAGQLRDPGGRRRLLLSALLCGLLISWWLVPHTAQLLSYMEASRQRVHETWITRLEYYTWGTHGSLPLLVAALLGTAAARRLGAAPGQALLLLGSSLAGALGCLVLVFDCWPRYLVPAFPVASVLCGLGLCALGRWAARHLGPALVKLLLGGGAIALMINFVADNLVGHPRSLVDREGAAGMVTPDRRPHDAYARAVIALGHLGEPALELPGGPELRGLRPVALSLIWERRGL